jgi:hypothetical protein
MTTEAKAKDAALIKAVQDDDLVCSDAPYAALLLREGHEALSRLTAERDELRSLASQAIDHIRDEDLRASFRASLEAASLPGPWRPIETAPKDGTEILVYGLAHGEPYYSIIAWREEWCMFHPEDDGYTMPVLEPLVWMLLPHPPAAPGKE